MLGFQGARTGPAEVELGVPSQTVLDLTQLARYGAANRPELADGWLTLRLNQITTGVGYAGSSQQILVGAAGASTPVAWVRQNWNFWIYDVSLLLGADVDPADAGDALMWVTNIDNSVVGTGTGQTNLIYAATEANDLYKYSALGAYMKNAHRPFFPFPVPYSAIINTSIQQDAAAGTLAWYWTVLGRMMPPGVAPLP